LSTGSGVPSGPPAAGRTVLLINAKARLGAQAEAAVASALRRHSLPLDRIVRVRRPNRLGQTVDILLSQGLGRQIVGGGDGTLSSVAPHLAGRDVLMGVIPLGTANDFARTLGIPLQPAAAAGVAAGAHVRAIDLARANDAHFLNVASVGVSVAMINDLSPRLKRWLGPGAYAVAGARAFLRHPAFRVRISGPDGVTTTEGRALQVVIGNGRFYGGGVLVAGGSTLDDGHLAVYTLGARGRWQLLRTIALLRMKVPLDRPGDAFFQAPEVRVESWPSKRVNLDGEVRTSTPVTFAVVPRALRVLTPETPAPGAARPPIEVGSGQKTKDRCQMTDDKGQKTRGVRVSPSAL
jgi:YegS/Rv2252/BmrU family lipid kinase